MKTVFFAIGLIVILLVVAIVLSGCYSPANSNPSFELSAPGCTATCDYNITHLSWSKVESANYYVIYAKQFTQGETPPSNPKIFEEIYRAQGNTQRSYDHITKDNFCYAVRAFGANGKSSDYSNVVFKL
jgi:hypothetical protein